MTLINQAWEDATAFLKRESSLLVPLALATIWVGDVVGTLARASQPKGEPSAIATFLTLAATLWLILGQLSIMALAMRPGSSVGEALRIGGTRLGKVLLTALLVGAGFVVALLPAAAGLVASGFNPEAPETLRNMPPWVAAYLALLSVVAIWLGARLLMLNPLIVDRNPGVIDAIKHGFALSRGLVWQIVLVLIVYVVVTAILTGAVTSVAGSLFALVGGALGSPFLGTVLTALASGLAGTALSMVAAVYVAMLYRRVSTGI